MSQSLPAERARVAPLLAVTLAAVAIVAAPAVLAAPRPSAVARLANVDFLSPDTAFAVAYPASGPSGGRAQLVRTSDGGRAWRTVAEGLPRPRSCPGFSAVAMAPGGQAGLLVLNDGPGAGSLPVCLWRTTDGGRRWRQSGTTVLLSGALAVTRLGGEVVAVNGAGAAPAATVTELVPTVRTLAQLADPSGPEGLAGAVTAVSVLAGGRGAALVSIGYVRGRAALYTYTANRPYRSWQAAPIRLPARTTAVSATAFATPGSGVAFLDAGGRNILTFTTDAGRTWVRAEAPLPDGVGQVEAIGPHRYAIVGTGGALWLSSDGGLRWFRQSPRGVP